MTTVLASRSVSYFAHLFQQIDALPKVLQDLIHEYNVDHRPQMYRICKELLTAYQYRMFRFTFDYHCCDGYDCENRYYECVDKNIYKVTMPYKIKKCLGHHYVFCSSSCEWNVLYDLRKQYYRSTCKRYPYKGYASEIKRYLCFLPDCHCLHCVEYRDFEKERREGTLDEFEGIDDYDEDYPIEFPENMDNPNIT